jgi:hypothetical protein
MSMLPFATGDRVRIRPAGSSNDEWNYAKVMIASENGRSIAVAPEECVMKTSVGAWLAGIVPLSIDFERETVTDLIGNEYELEYQPSDVTVKDVPV